jgi:hypothetical protein
MLLRGHRATGDHSTRFKESLDQVKEGDTNDEMKIFAIAE